MKSQEKSKNSGMVFFIDNVKIVISAMGKGADFMAKAILMDCYIKKYAYKEISQIYREIGALQKKK
ncbi:hypothetical protein [Blautia sp. HCN-1074]|jgi:hypothetical protein|uniref:hypothetical protein n=1 Tax=Blautia sp. HCN-1074 TaxID=3134667 RepID=UPI0030BC28AF